MEKLEDPASVLISMSDALRTFPLVELNVAAVQALKFGIPPKLTEISVNNKLVSGEMVRFHADQQLMAVARFNPERTHEKRGDFELQRVFVSY